MDFWFASKSGRQWISIGLMFLVPFGFAMELSTQLENPDFEIGQIPDGWVVPKALADQGFSAVLTDRQSRPDGFCIRDRKEMFRR